MADGAEIQAVSVAVRRGDMLLLVERGRPPSLGLFAFPGGRVEPGETSEQAARRELQEETGLKAGCLDFIETVVLRPEGDEGPGFRVSVYLCADAEGEPTAGDDAAAAGFFSLDAMASLPMTPSTEALARRLLAAAERHLPD